MSFPLLLLAACLMQQPATPAAGEQQKPPEEDDSAKPIVYSFNPLNANKDVRTGDYYMKKGNYKAAVARYRDATRWNDQLAEAFRKLGDAEEKFDEPQQAREAYQKFLELDPDSKQAAEVRKRIERLSTRKHGD